MRSVTGAPAAHQSLLPRLPEILLPVALLGLLLLSLVGLVLPPAGWSSVVYHLMYLMAIVSMGQRGWYGMGTSRSIAWLAIAAALVLGELYQLGSALSVPLHLAEPLAVTAWLFNAGEACVAAGGFALWWAYGHGGSWRSWIAPGILAIAFAAGYLVNGEMSGVLAIWSMGLTLYLPWPLYAASLCLAGVTVVVSLGGDRMVAWAILLLAAGGYAPQLTSQAFLGLIALWLLLSRATQADPLSVAAPQTEPPIVTTGVCGAVREPVVERARRHARCHRLAPGYDARNGQPRTADAGGDRIHSL